MDSSNSCLFLSPRERQTQAKKQTNWEIGEEMSETLPLFFFIVIVFLSGFPLNVFVAIIVHRRNVPTKRRGVRRARCEACANAKHAGPP
jgi:hypothetical protein